eukprot:Skav200690  [mRNA]  locus=scaffold1446:507978:509367:- [translate_table: standard]
MDDAHDAWILPLSAESELKDAVVSAVRSMTDLGQLGSYALPQSRVTISTVGAWAMARCGLWHKCEPFLFQSVRRAAMEQSAEQGHY